MTILYLQDTPAQSPDIPSPEAGAADAADPDTGFAALEALLDNAGEDEIPASQEEVENLVNCLFAMEVDESVSPPHNDGGGEVAPALDDGPPSVASLEGAKSFDNLDTLAFLIDTQAGLDCASELPPTQPMPENESLPVLHRTSGPVSQAKEFEGKDADLPNDDPMIGTSELETFNQQLAMAAGGGGGGGGSFRLLEWDLVVPANEEAPIEIDSNQATPVKHDLGSDGPALSFDQDVGSMSAQQRMEHLTILMKQVKDRLAGIEPKESEEAEKQVESSAPGQCPKDFV